VCWLRAYGREGARWVESCRAPSPRGNRFRLDVRDAGYRGLGSTSTAALGSPLVSRDHNGGDRRRHSHASGRHRRLSPGDRWPIMRIGTRTYMRGTCERNGGNYDSARFLRKDAVRDARRCGKRRPSFATTWRATKRGAGKRRRCAFRAQAQSAPGIASSIRALRAPKTYSTKAATSGSIRRLTTSGARGAPSSFLRAEVVKTLSAMFGDAYITATHRTRAIPVRSQSGTFLVHHRRPQGAPSRRQRHPPPLERCTLGSRSLIAIQVCCLIVEHVPSQPLGETPWAFPR
jgi:hypothetical protein